MVSGGYASGPDRYLDSTEMLLEDQNLWTKVNGLTLPSGRRGPLMINLNNNIFLSGLILMNLWVPQQYLSKFLSFLGGEITDDILNLNQESLTWIEVARMKKKRFGHRGSVIDLTGHLMSHCN